MVILGRRPAETLMPGPQALEPGSAQNAHRSCRPSRAGFPRMCLPPRQLAEALLFLCKALAVKKRKMW